VVHDTNVAGPLGAGNMNLAKGLVAERALQVLSDETHEQSLAQICTCHSAMVVDEIVEPGPAKNLTTEDTGDNAPNDETTEGFKIISLEKLKEIAADTAPSGEETVEDIEGATEPDERPPKSTIE
jgi:hypothetical protein